MASNSIIRIYPSFTEIRQNVETKSPHQIYFPQDLYNQIMGGSINLEGVNVTAMNAVLRENNLEGKIVHINKDKTIREVKMIRSRDSLVQDLATLRYYHVDKSQIEFTEIPEETGTEVTFKLEKDGAAVLSYLMFGITWKPRYSLNIHGESHTFQGWADITNNTQKLYSVDKTELFGGDVNITQHRTRAGVMYMAMARDMGAPKIKAEGEIAGLYMYSISDGYTLEPRSTFSLPFVAPTIVLKKVALIDSYFSHTNNNGQSSRVYKIKSDEFLPTGSVTIREDGRVVGQAQVPNLSVDENTDLSVGNDPDVSFERNVKVISHNEDISQYAVTVNIKNRKARDVNYEFIEHFHGRFEIETKFAGALIQNDYLKSESVIKAKSDVAIDYLIKFFHKF